MPMDFSNGAGAATSSDVIPNGQLAWAFVTVRGLKPSGSGGQYLDIELTLDEGQPYGRKKLWEMVGDPNHSGNSEAYRQMGLIAITRMLEAGRGAGPNNPAGYQINQYSDLNGLRVPIKIKVEPGKDGHADKNRVAEWLTPNPASQSGHKGFVMLSEGKHNVSTAQPAAQVQGGFGNAGGGAPAQTSGFAAAAQQGGTPAAQSGFSQPQQGSNGFVQGSGAAEQSTQAENTATSATSPTNPGATPNWLQQAAQ